MCYYHVTSLSEGWKLKTMSSRGAYLTLQQGNIFQIKQAPLFTDKVTDTSQKQQQCFFLLSNKKDFPHWIKMTG